ncbi:hypothetical protein ADUPG1_012071 [Aduncisulcus paluster]|uniref:Uncharacterized protein n=1 Tax=Aduncisulcus paluster TaxID=2918883 RepID=A0ABQ5JY72_9EUKA|nr:hypothetical protein ADUPG1_012071 [Aduncisulcus paluster]
MGSYLSTLFDSSDDIQRISFLKNASANPPPISLDDPLNIAIDDTRAYGKLGDYVRLLSEVRDRFLKDRSSIEFSYLFLPFEHCCDVACIYICVDILLAPSELLITFVQDNGNRVSRTCTISKVHHRFEWHRIHFPVKRAIQCEFELTKRYPIPFIYGVRFIASVHK